MIIAEKRLKRIIKEELDEYMIDNLARIYFGPNPENRAQAKEVLLSLDQEKQVLFLLIEKMWEGYPTKQIKEMASSYGVLSELLQLYKNSILHMLYGWDSDVDALYVSYIHPTTEKEIELDIPVDWDLDLFSPLFAEGRAQIDHIVEELVNNFPLSEYLKNNIGQKLENKIAEKFD